MAYSVSNLVLSAACLIFGFGILRRLHGVRAAVKWKWAVGFFALAVGAGIAFLFHSSAIVPSMATQDMLWEVVFAAILIANYAFVIAVIPHAMRRRSLVKMLSVLAAVFVGASFIYVDPSVSYAPALLSFLILMLVMVVPLAFRIFTARSREERGPLALVLVGVGVIFFASAVQYLGHGFAPWLNYNDLYHYLMIPAMWILYVAALRLELPVRSSA